jgi:GT2 family glycosyltransferase
VIDISVIIVNFNTPDLLKQCLNSLLQARKVAPKLEIETIVVNVTPEDGSDDFLSHGFNWVRQVKTTTNDGFAANNNKALPYANGKYLLYLNSDTVVDPEAILFVYEKMLADPNVGAATCKIDLVSGGIDMNCHRGFPTPWASLCHFTGLSKLFPHSKLFNQYYLGFLPLNKEHEIDSLEGAFMLIPKAVGQKVGFWDEDFFFYGDDIDFCYRIKEAGYKVMYYPQVRITHFKGASSGLSNQSKEVLAVAPKTRMKLAVASIDAMKVFYKKHWMEEYPRWVTRLVFIGIAVLRAQRTLKFRLAKC